jgi:hypothetical protein|tara:strand:- start:18 stop:251 length:234 start_codon:yes stop_codon:yes gene_type:complete
MNEELIQKQFKLLGLIFGMWALFLVNMLILNIILVEDWYLPTLGMQILGMDTEIMPLPLSLITIFQMWAIYKYILKK